MCVPTRIAAHVHTLRTALDTHTCMYTRVASAYLDACMVVTPLGADEQLVTIRAMVARVSDVKPMAKVVTYTCEQCGFEVYQEVRHCHCCNTTATNRLPCHAWS
jgi:DNA replicative helicase MCM subunit Mcm2 (Cdc46/Mcm family)